MQSPENSTLGQKTAYISSYDAKLLFPIPRLQNRQGIGIHSTLPFKGVDIWNAYEVSWLNEKGKPLVMMAEFRIPCESENLIESKSLKLYLNSFNQSRFADMESVRQAMVKDLSRAAGAEVSVMFRGLDDISAIHALPGLCIDDLDINIDQYEPSENLLEIDSTQFAQEVLHSNLLKSNCPVTNQPDWGSVVIEYKGPKINHESLLAYIISFRQHNEFHEHCVERMFVGLKHHCHCEALTIYARYVRRGGLDINPYRSTEKLGTVENLRVVRQ